MAAKSSDEKKSHMVTIRMDRPMKASMDEAAEATGRSLSGEIQHRLADYESLRGFVDRLLDDSVTINSEALKMLTARVEALEKQTKSFHPDWNPPPITSLAIR